MYEKLTITDSERDEFTFIRQQDATAQRPLRQDLMRRIKQRLSIPAEVRIKVNVNDQTSENYMVVCEKHTGRPLCGTPNLMGRATLARVRALVSTDAAGAPLYTLPIGALSIDGAMYVHDGYLYFPVSE